MGELGQTEIENLQTSITGHAKICRLQIAVNDALRMRRPQALGEFEAQTGHFIRWQAARNQRLVQRFTRDIFRDQEVSFIGGVEVMDGGNIGVVQLGQREGFLAKPLAGGLVSQGAGRQDF